jgi:hypothetical protein
VDGCASRKSSIFSFGIVSSMFMRVNAKCAHQVRPPRGPILARRRLGAPPDLESTRLRRMWSAPLYRKTLGDYTRCILVIEYTLPKYWR